MAIKDRFQNFANRMFDPGPNITQESVQQNQALADALMANSMRPQTIEHPLQGLALLANALNAQAFRQRGERGQKALDAQRAKQIGDVLSKLDIDAQGRQLLESLPAEMREPLLAEVVATQFQPKESPFAKIDPKDYTPESIAEFRRTSDPSSLRRVAGTTDSPFAKLDPKDFTPESIAEFTRTNDFSVLRPAMSPDIERVGQRVVTLPGQNPFEAEVFRDKTSNQLFINAAQGRVPLQSNQLTTPIDRSETGGPGSFGGRTGSQFGEDVQAFQDSAISFSGAVSTAADLAEIASNTPEALGAPGAIIRVGNEFVRTADALGGMLGVDIGIERDLGDFDFSKFRTAAIENQAFRAGVFNIALATAVAEQGSRPSDKDVQFIIDQLGASTADPQAFARVMQGFVKRLDQRLRATARVKNVPEEVQARAFTEMDRALERFNSLAAPSGVEALPGWGDLTPAEQEELRRLSGER